MQTVPMGSSLAVHVLKPGCRPLHWMLPIPEFVPTWPAIAAAEVLECGFVGLHEAFDEHIASRLAGLDAADSPPSAVAIPSETATPKVATVQSVTAAHSLLMEPLEPEQMVFPAVPRIGPGAIHMPGAGLLGSLEPPDGGVGGMLIGPDHPGFRSQICPQGGTPAHGLDGAPLAGARWDPIHGHGYLGDPDAGQGGDADLQRPPTGIDDTDIDSMFM